MINGQLDSERTDENEIRSQGPSKRVLVAFLNRSTRGFIEYASARSVPVKDNLSIPLVLICLAGGLSSSLTQAIFKFHGEILQSGELSFWSPFELSLISVGGIMAALGLLMLNLAM